MKPITDCHGKNALRNNAESASPKCTKTIGLSSVSGFRLILIRFSDSQVTQVLPNDSDPGKTAVSSGSALFAILSAHCVNVSVLIKFSQKTSFFTLIIISSP